MLRTALIVACLLGLGGCTSDDKPAGTTPAPGTLSTTATSTDALTTTTDSGASESPTTGDPQTGTATAPSGTGVTTGSSTPPATGTTTENATSVGTGPLCGNKDCMGDRCFDDPCLNFPICVGPAPKSCRDCAEAACPDLAGQTCESGIDCINLGYATGGCGVVGDVIAQPAFDCFYVIGDCLDACVGAGTEACLCF